MKTSIQSNNSQTPLKQSKLPNLIIIGAMKCGTSSLHQYLNLHPQIHMSQTKELDFFITAKNWGKGLEWYQSNFTEHADVIGESSPNYTKYPIFKGVPERMHHLIPDAKLIYVVRDPIKRIISHYTHQFTNRDEHRTLDEAFAHLENNHYVDCSRYTLQIEQFLPYYSWSRILVVSLEELSHNRMVTLKRVFRFLEVDDAFEHAEFSTVFHQSSQKKRLTNLGARLFALPAGGRLLKFLPNLMAEKVQKPTMSPAVRSNLVNALQDDVNKLRELTQQSFSEWSL
jgi:hypothetical protein